MISLELEQISDTAMRLVHENGPANIIIDRPLEKGGSGKGLMGGQYLLLGVGGCFCSTLFAASTERNIKIQGLKVTVNATIGEETPKRFSQIHLNISYEKCSHESEFKKLVKIAEKGCLSINTIKNGVNFATEVSI